MGNNKGIVVSLIREGLIPRSRDLQIGSFSSLQTNVCSVATLINVYH